VESQGPLLTPTPSSFSGQVLLMALVKSPSSSAPPCDGIPAMDVVEVPVLLPGWQALALEDAAHDRGLTAGEMLRHLLSDFFTRPKCKAM
jgi:hypothetical protein